MSAVLKKVVLAILLLFGATAVPARETALPIAVGALQGDLLQKSEWDFSRQWLTDDRARMSVRVYGDSLLAETYGSRRFWYGIGGDSLTYRGEEDRLTTITPDSAVFVASLPFDFGTGNISVFEARGTGGGRRFEVREHVALEYAASPRPGILIIAPGDTISNVLLVRERRHVTVSFPDDSLAADMYMVTEICRWYDKAAAETLLPLAVQRSVYTVPLSEDAKPVSSSAYLPERGAYGERSRDNAAETDNCIDPDAVGKALDNAAVSCDGRTVTVRAAMPQAGLHIAVDVMDAAGRLYMHEDAVSGTGTDEITLDCSSLRQGQYIAAVGVEDVAVAPKKELVIIR